MKTENVIYEIKALIKDTIMAENEGSRRCLNSNDLNKFESWIKILEQANSLPSDEETRKEIKYPKGTKVKICNGLETVIEKVEWEKLTNTYNYWFRDENKHLWAGDEDIIELI